MPRLTQSYVSDVRRSRLGEGRYLRPRAKRLPITSLWDAMASAAPVASFDPLHPRAPSGWDGRPVVDDDELRDVPEVVIRHVSAMTRAAALFGELGPAGAARGRGAGAGVQVVALDAEDSTVASGPRTAVPPYARPGVRAALLGLAVVLVVLTWRVAQSGHAVARSQGAGAASDRPAAQKVARSPGPPTAAPTADIVGVASPAAPDPVPVAAITPAVAPASGPAADFDYRSARRYLDEQAGFLRQTCMRRAKAPLQRLRIHVKARPNGRAAIAVPGAGAEVAACVREALNFPFDRSPNGGAFVYSLGATGSRLAPRPL